MTGWWRSRAKTTAARGSTTARSRPSPSARWRSSGCAGAGRWIWCCAPRAPAGLVACCACARTRSTPRLLFPDRTDARQRCAPCSPSCSTAARRCPYRSRQRARVRPQRFESLASFEACRCSARAAEQLSRRSRAGRGTPRAGRGSARRRADREVAPGRLGRAVARLCLAAHEQREAGEEQLDERPGKPVAQAQRVEAHDPADALRALLEVAAHGLARADAAQLDAAEARGAGSRQLLRLVLVDVERVHAVGHQTVRRRDQRHAARREQPGDRVEVEGRVRQVLDHLEAHDQLEAARRERHALEARAHETRAARAARRDRAGCGRGRPRADASARGSRCRSPTRSRGRARGRAAAGARQLVGRLVAREVDREERVARVQSLAGEGDVVRQAASAPRPAPRARTRARRSRPISSRSEIRPKESTRLIARIVSGGADRGTGRRRRPARCRGRRRRSGARRPPPGSPSRPRAASARSMSKATKAAPATATKQTTKRQRSPTSSSRRASGVARSAAKTASERRRSSGPSEPARAGCMTPKTMPAAQPRRAAPRAAPRGGLREGGAERAERERDHEVGEHDQQHDARGLPSETPVAPAQQHGEPGAAERVVG